MNVQLMAVCLWKHPDYILELSIKNNEIDTLLSEFVNYYGRLQEVQQRKRIILGKIWFMHRDIDDTNEMGVFVEIRKNAKDSRNIWDFN